ncbi:hypothetical protein Tco_0191503 [Tanacetum coccineum]
MEKARNKPKGLLPYGMLLTTLFKHVVSIFPELAIDHYLSHDRVMHPFVPHYERKTRSDHGKKRSRDSNASSSFTTLNDEKSFHSNSSSFLKRLLLVQSQQRDAHWEGLRSIGKALKDMMSGKRK